MRVAMTPPRMSRPQTASKPRTSGRTASKQAVSAQKALAQTASAQKALAQKASTQTAAAQTASTTTASTQKASMKTTSAKSASIRTASTQTSSKQSASTQSASMQSASTQKTGRLLLTAGGRLVLEGGAAFELEPKDALLAAYLAIEGATPRSRLAALLWPEADDERALGNLRQRLMRLKRATGVELIVGNPRAALADGIGHDLDEGHELLRGIDPHQAGGMAEWLEAQRGKRRRAHVERLDAVIERAETEGDLGTALEQANALVEIDPVSEHAHRRLMRLHYLRGDSAAALAAYEHCRRTLKRELNAEPSSQTEALRASVGTVVAPLVEVPALRAVPMSVLRPPRLIGRERDWDALQAAWEEGRPALVLGEAGMGKTRLVSDFARARGAVAVVAARPGDERVVYALATRLLRQLPREALTTLNGPVRRELARLLPELGEAAPID
jgi:DNA-binding SARP family transcriptional activator